MEKALQFMQLYFAPEDVRIFTYPNFPEILNKEETVLIFPSPTGIPVDSLFIKESRRG